MAQQFGDDTAAEAIRAAPTTLAAEEKMKEIKGFDEAVWNGVCLDNQSANDCFR